MSSCDASQNPWVRWIGGKCPVPDLTIVEVKYRNGQIEYPLPACEVDWGEPRHWGDWDWDIVAYRLAQPDSDNSIPEPPPLYVFDARCEASWQEFEYGGVTLSNLIARVYLTRDLVARLAQELRERNPQTVELDANTVLGIVRNFLDSAQEIERELSEKELPPSGISYHMLWDRIERLISDLGRVKAPLPERSTDTLRELEKIADERYEEIVQLKEQLDAERQAARNQLATTQSELSVSQASLSAWMTTARDAQADFERADRLARTRDQAITELLRERDGLQAKVKDLELDVQDLQAIVKQWQDRALERDALEREIEALRREFKSVDHLCEERLVEIQDQQHTIGELRAQAEHEKQRRHNAEAMVDDLAQERNDLQKTLAELRQTNLFNKLWRARRPDSDKTLDDCKDKFSNYQLNFRTYDKPCAYTLVDPKQARLYGYVLAVEAIQSGKHFGQFDDRTQNAIRYFITPENIRLALES